MATLKQTNDEIESSIRRAYRKGIGAMDDYLLRDKLRNEIGYLQKRLETCKREAAAIPKIEADLSALHQQLEQFNERVGA